MFNSFFVLTFSPTLNLSCFLPSCFVLLICYRDAINSQHSVSKSAHHKTAGLKVHSFESLRSFSQNKKISPWTLALAHLSVKNIQSKIQWRKKWVIANGNHRHCFRSFTFGKTDSLLITLNESDTKDFWITMGAIECYIFRKTH